MLWELLVEGEQAVGHRNGRIGGRRTCASKEGKGVREVAVCVWGLVLQRSIPQSWDSCEKLLRLLLAPAKVKPQRVLLRVGEQDKPGEDSC